MPSSAPQPPPAWITINSPLSEPANSNTSTQSLLECQSFCSSQAHTNPNLRLELQTRKTKLETDQPHNNHYSTADVNPNRKCMSPSDRLCGSRILRKWWEETVAEMRRSSCAGGSVVAMKRSYVGQQYKAQGMRRERVEVDEGETVIRCWIPWRQPERGVWSAGVADKPALLLLHDFVADGTISWEKQVGAFCGEFNVYVPDLLFFGGSETSSAERTEAFQAECMVKMLHALEVYNEVTVVGAGYGGVVAFWMAHLYPKLVERVAFVAAGTHMTPTSQKPLLAELDCDHISELLLPTSVKGLQRLASVATHKPAYWLPKFICNDVLNVFMDENRHEKGELLSKMVCSSRGGRPLPPLTQEKSLIIWGAKDQITSLELALKLKLHLGNATDLVVMNKCGHFPQVENPASFNRILRNFLESSSNSTPI